MSLDVPENMEEVAMKIAQASVHGQKLTKEAVIMTAVRDILQAYLDEALEGHYDDVKMLDNGTLVVTDVMGSEAGRIKPLNGSWVNDFEQNADALDERFADEAQKIVGHR
ncbi:hypothetical protein [uncultured Limosilactobacillus sp.]|uniref:hypothetical protein n=1 Tax=uncultured Limosilactobacillus sp. TaxID=2837629 RepID=UPI0025F1FE25|nr:hypothetical protein [uncultured Limosilactobacillus sp.]